MPFIVSLTFCWRVYCTCNIKECSIAMEIREWLEFEGKYSFISGISTVSYCIRDAWRTAYNNTLGILL